MGHSPRLGNIRGWGHLTRTNDSAHKCALISINSAAQCKSERAAPKVARSDLAAAGTEFVGRAAAVEDAAADVTLHVGGGWCNLRAPMAVIVALASQAYVRHWRSGTDVIAVA